MSLSNRNRLRTLAAPAILAVALSLAACSQTDTPKPPATTDASSPTATLDPSATPDASATPTPSDAANAEGSAADNLPAFTKVVQAVWAGPNKVQGRAYIDALVAAGFADKTKMQVTADYMGIGEPAESIIFSVNWKGECIIGQVGPETGTPTTMIAPVLGSGLCLPGETVTIDW